MTHNNLASEEVTAKGNGHWMVSSRHPLAPNVHLVAREKGDDALQLVSEVRAAGRCNRIHRCVDCLLQVKSVALQLQQRPISLSLCVVIFISFYF